MLRKSSPVFNRLLNHIVQIPVVDCHEHLSGPDRDLNRMPKEPIAALTLMYFISDLWAAGANDGEIMLLQSEEATTDDKWPIFSRLWAATEHTAYARITKLLLSQTYGVNEITRNSLEHVAEQLATRDPSYYIKTIHDAGIKAVIADVLFPPPRERPIRYYGSPVLKEFLSAKFRLPDIWHPVFNLPYYHEIRTAEFIGFVGSVADMPITSLAEYEEAMFSLFKRAKELGVIALKDQSAYRRIIAYDLPVRSDAERIFNKLLISQRSQLAWPEAKPLDDYLFHQFIRFARELHLPVQIHTGHLANIRNRVDQANAAYLAPVLELHSEVQFDLFHGNWPYMGDLLFLGKNYPNVALDLCWVNMIDPIYAQELLKRAVMTVPHTKIFAFGGDYFIAPEFSVAHLALAREVVTSALADLVESGWLGEEDATRIAADWFYNNPNRFYSLGLPAYEV
jgi:predicted TIM-barrel fold metal-dependent hydrolase